MTEGLANADTPAGVLARGRANAAIADRAEARSCRPRSPGRRCTRSTAWPTRRTCGSAPTATPAIPVAGPGAPLVAEFSVAEFAAAVGLSTDAGRGYLGEAVELRYRLPRLWARVASGDLAAWRARRIAGPPSP